MFVKFIDAITTRIADNVIALFKAGQAPASFEMVGFSIGAQYAGYVGRKVNSRSSGNYTLPRIVGLEPSNELFVASQKLGPSDATFVMTIHTGAALSDPKVLGHVAFFPNGGITQPMCNRRLFFITYNDAACSHGQVQFFWIEAVTTKSATVFPARKCNNDTEFYNRQCNTTIDIAYMNTQTPSSLRGNYYLSTFNTSPFSKSTANP